MGLASRADEVATRAIVAVVATTGTDGRYCSVKPSVSHCVSQTFPSGVNLYPVTFSVPA